MRISYSNGVVFTNVCKTLLIMEILMSMVDFVLLKSKIPYIIQTESEFYDIVTNYANFLKQPLSIEMFVPCDEDGILEKPKDYDDIMLQGSRVYHHDDILGCKSYYQAKERCLFEGIEYVQAKKEGHYSFLRIANLSHINYPSFWNGHTVEDLVKYKPKLTATAQKQIGL